MDDKLEKRKSFIINVTYFAVCIGIYYVFFKFIAPAAWPFLVALIVALLLRTPIRRFSRLTRFRHNLSAVLVVAFFYVAIGLLIFLVISRAVLGIAEWFVELPRIYLRYVEPYLESGLDWIRNLFASFNESTATDFSGLAGSITDKLFSLVSAVPGRIFNIAQSLALSAPSALVGVIITLVSSFFMSTDYIRLRHFIFAQLPEDKAVILRDGREYLASSISHMIVGYALVLLITFVECAIGLSIIGIKNAIVIAVIIALFDILPILGTGAIVWPWAIISLANGNTHDGIGLIIMYFVITVVRQYTEPKIVGEKVGLHPILMLMAIFMGAKIFGAVGIVILPFTLIVVKKLNDDGRIHIFNSDYFDGNYDAETDRGIPIEREHGVRIYQRRNSSARKAEAAKGAGDGSGSPDNINEKDNNG